MPPLRDAVLDPAGKAAPRIYYTKRGYHVSIITIFAMLRRHLIAVAVVCLVAGGLGYHLLHEDPGYSDSGTMAITAPSAWGEGSAFTDLASLLTTEEVAGWYMMSPQGKQAVRATGGTASYDVAFYNSYTQQYPDFNSPYLIVTANSQDPTEVQTTFNTVIKVLVQDIANRQIQWGASPKELINATLTDSTGPVANKGSHKRTIIGLIVLVIIAAYMVARFLDRRRIRRFALIRDRIPA